MTALLMKYLAPGLGILLVIGIVYHFARVVIYTNEIHQLEGKVASLERKNATLEAENRRIFVINEDLSLQMDKQNMSITRMEMDYHRKLTAANEALKQANSRAQKMVATADTLLKKPDVPKDQQCIEAFKDVDLYLGIRQGK